MRNCTKFCHLLFYIRNLLPKKSIFFGNRLYKLSEYTSFDNMEETLREIATSNHTSKEKVDMVISLLPHLATTVITVTNELEGDDRPFRVINIGEVMTYYVAYNHLDDTILDISSGTQPVPVKEYVEKFKDIIIPDKIIENNGFRVSKDYYIWIICYHPLICKQIDAAKIFSTKHLY